MVAKTEVGYLYVKIGMNGTLSLNPSTYNAMNKQWKDEENKSSTKVESSWSHGRSRWAKQEEIKAIENGYEVED